MNTVASVLEKLFAGPDSSQPVTFHWRLVTRNHKPFLLLPARPELARTGLQLYSAQRLRAKIWSRVLPSIFRTPLAQFFPEVTYTADGSRELLQFLARLSGVPVERVTIGAIKFSEIGERARLVLLLCDESGRPAQVVKVGLNAAGRAATEREADFLAQLPASKLGCIRMTGRLGSADLTAFATEYFPGVSPFDDAGMEHLFHDWLDTTEPVPLETLPAWSQLSGAVGEPQAAAWQQINTALARQEVYPTLYHGDFAPWNIRVVNARNLQVFDWERGHTRGVPGWDWFHFTIQTAILARRHPAERAAAEVEQLLHSPRFQKYAAAAGIRDCVRPLVLAYLLHHLWVNRPLEGSETCRELFNLLQAHWSRHPLSSKESAPITALANTGDLRSQLLAAVRQWNNLFWEPTLNSTEHYAWGAELKRHGSYLLLAAALAATIASVQYHANTHIMFLPFFVVLCGLLTWKAGRRLGAVFAALAAVTSPVVVAFMENSFRNPEVMVWNSVMRFIILELCVLFVDRIHKQKAFVHHRLPAGESLPKLTENWAVAALCLVALAGITYLDFITDPLLTFLPLYILPCMMFTLVFGIRRGLVTGLVASGASTWVEYATTKSIHYTTHEIFLWNLPMRACIMLTVLFLLNRIRRENILFFSNRAKD